MGGNLVEQKDRPLAAILGDKIGMGEDEAEEQRLLLAGRAALRRLHLAEMGDLEVGTVRPRQRPPRRRITPVPVLATLSEPRCSFIISTRRTSEE